MTNNGRPDQRTQAIKYLGKAATDPGEFIKLLVEWDMQNMAPRATPLQIIHKEATQVNPTQQNSEKAKRDLLERRQEEMERQLANQGLKQREESLERWEEETVQYMEYLTNKGDMGAFIQDEYWHSLPDRVRRAERRLKKYNKRLRKFLTVERTTGEGRRINLRICNICGRVFLEKREDRHSLKAHLHNKH